MKSGGKVQGLGKNEETGLHLLKRGSYARPQQAKTARERQHAGQTARVWNICHFSPRICIHTHTVSWLNLGWNDLIISESEKQ